MLICKLIDSIWATRKYEELDGMKLMRVEVIDGPEFGRRLVCVDTISAGYPGDRVLVGYGFGCLPLHARDLW